MGYWAVDVPKEKQHELLRKEIRKLAIALNRGRNIG